MKLAQTFSASPDGIDQQRPLSIQAAQRSTPVVGSAKAGKRSHRAPAAQSVLPARKLPACTEGDSVLDADLRSRAAAGGLVKIVVTTCPDGNYAAAYFVDDPLRPIYLATRRDRTQPKVYIDVGRLISSLGDLATLGTPITFHFT